MNDIKYIRENKALFDSKLAARGLSSMSDILVDTDKELRTVITNLQILQARRNDIIDEIAKKRCAGENTAELASVSITIKEEIDSLKENEARLRFSLDSMLSEIPNVISDDVPTGKNETDNKFVRSFGEPRKFEFTPLSHYEIGEKLELMDFKTAVKLSGSRFSIMKGALARLEWAIASFMLDTHTMKFGYTQMYVPYLVNSDVMFGTGQLPKFADDLFCTKDDRWLIPTAEVPLTNTVRDSTLDISELPLRLTAYTQCFRAEAGSAGRDTKGMIRNHQFSKVELVSIVHPKDEFDELERMTSCAEHILQELDLPYRVMALCSGDIGFSARKTYDIEVWLPSENMYREISSCSTCGQFQARRMKTKYKDGKEKDFVVTLNGSGLAVGRTLVAILENYQNADGSVTVPSALRDYMKCEVIEVGAK